MPGSGEAASYGDLLVTSLLVLGGVCVAAFVVVRFLGRFLATGPRRGAHLLDVVARMPLEPRRSLYVVDVAGKTLLVGTSEMGLSVLTELDRDAVQARVVERPTFAEMVRTAWTKRKARGAAEVALNDREPGERSAAREISLPDAESVGTADPSRTSAGADSARVESASAERASTEIANVGSLNVGTPNVGSRSAGSPNAGSQRVSSPDVRSAGEPSVAGSANAGSTNAVAEPGHTPARKPGEPA